MAAAIVDWFQDLCVVGWLNFLQSNSIRQCNEWRNRDGSLYHSFTPEVKNIPDHYCHCLNTRASIATVMWLTVSLPLRVWRGAYGHEGEIEWDVVNRTLDSLIMIPKVLHLKTFSVFPSSLSTLPFSSLKFSKSFEHTWSKLGAQSDTSEWHITQTSARKYWWKVRPHYSSYRKTNLTWQIFHLLAEYAHCNWGCYLLTASTIISFIWRCHRTFGIYPFDA